MEQRAIPRHLALITMERRPSHLKRLSRDQLNEGAVRWRHRFGDKINCFLDQQWQRQSTNGAPAQVGQRRPSTDS
jgi:hypothetical protein